MNWQGHEWQEDARIHSCHLKKDRKYGWIPKIWRHFIIRRLDRNVKDLSKLRKYLDPLPIGWNFRKLGESITYSMPFYYDPIWKQKLMAIIIQDHYLISWKEKKSIPLNGSLNTEEEGEVTNTMSYGKDILLLKHLGNQNWHSPLMVICWQTIKKFINFEKLQNDINMPFSLLWNTKSMPNLPKRNKMERNYEQFPKEIDQLDELMDTMLHQSQMQRPINIWDLLGSDEYPSKPFFPPYLEQLKNYPWK